MYGNFLLCVCVCVCVPTAAGEDENSAGVKFVGRRIRHEWITRSQTGVRKWYTGVVKQLLSGTDGALSSRYLIRYDGENEEYEIDHLVEDYVDGSVQLLPI